MVYEHVTKIWFEHVFVRERGEGGRERERECVFVCVCVREREIERGNQLRCIDTAKAR